MLIISRKVSESILIGDDIEIIISEITADKVKIGVKAPKEIPILRHELYEVAHLNEEASEASKLSQSQAIDALKNLFK